MSRQVRLLTGKQHDNSLMPELIGVFRAVTKTPPINISQHVFYNSWLLTGLFHHRNANTHLALRGNKSVPIQIANQIMRLALSIEPEDDTYVMGGQELSNYLQRSNFLLGYFAKRLDETSYHIPDTLLSLSQTALAFNQMTLHQRAEYYREPDDEHCDKRRMLAPDVNPFIQAYVAAHLMDIIGLRMRDAHHAPDLSATFRSFMPMLRGKLPLHADMHSADEKQIHNAVMVLRHLNYRLEEILRAPVGEYLPDAVGPERRLAEELFMYTKGYREPVPHDASPPRNPDPIGPRPNNVIPLRRPA